MTPEELETLVNNKAYLIDTDGDSFKETLRVQVTFATAPANGETVPIYWYAEVVQ